MTSALIMKARLQLRPLVRVSVAFVLAFANAEAFVGLDNFDDNSLNTTLWDARDFNDDVDIVETGGVQRFSTDGAPNDETDGLLWRQTIPAGQSFEVEVDINIPRFNISGNDDLFIGMEIFKEGEIGSGDSPTLAAITVFQDNDAYSFDLEVNGQQRFGFGSQGFVRFRLQYDSNNQEVIGLFSQDGGSSYSEIGRINAGGLASGANNQIAILMGTEGVNVSSSANVNFDNFAVRDTLTIPAEPRTLSLGISPFGGGSTSQGGDGDTILFDDQQTVNIQAFPNPGYLFENWTGDISSTDNPLSFPITGDVSVTANFREDSNDDDNDGLTNFRELAELNTNPNSPDTFNDGVLDAVAVVRGIDPSINYNGVLALVREMPGDFGIAGGVTQQDIEASLAELNLPGIVVEGTGDAGNREVSIAFDIFIGESLDNLTLSESIMRTFSLPGETQFFRVTAGPQ